MFKSLHNLKKLNLSENDLEELEPGTFDALNKLQRLDLYNNNLQNLEPRIFDNLNKLQKLYLGYNNINHLPSKVCYNLDELETLGLNGNGLQTIEPNAFDTLYNLQKLYLGNNNLKPRNLIGIFKNLNKLQVLDLSDNDLDNLESQIFNGLHQLKSLDLDNNDLTVLKSGLFHGLNKLKTIGLKNTKLQFVEPQVFDRLSENEYNKIDLLDLRENPDIKPFFVKPEIYQDVEVDTLRKQLDEFPNRIRFYRQYNRHPNKEEKRRFINELLEWLQINPHDEFMRTRAENYLNDYAPEGTVAQKPAHKKRCPN